jgi:ATP phosphoribosyltransferase regulatory subunit
MIERERTMHDLAAAALLPAGLMDVLPPNAAFEARTVERLLAHFTGFGYERVKPPLIEFAETMLAGSGAALAAETFQLMDPISQRMLALRPDMTMQVARIAATRLAHWPRPLRLSYAGQVMRVRGSQLRPERQFGQAGAEIVGAASAAADIEVIVMATTALADLGVRGLTVDLGLPTLVPAILDAAPHAARADRRLRLALDRKDVSAIAGLSPAIGAGAASVLATLAATGGPAEQALSVLAALDLPDAAAAERASLQAVYEGLRRAAPALGLTVDPVEHRGFEYHTGVTYAVFAAAAPDELARGGRYRTEAGEAAAGVTLFMDAVQRALPRPQPAHRLLLAPGTPEEVASELRRQGWIAIAMLEPAADLETEAARLGCEHVYANGRPRPVTAAQQSQED